MYSQILILSSVSSNNYRNSSAFTANIIPVPKLVVKDTQQFFIQFKSFAKFVAIHYRKLSRTVPKNDQESYHRLRPVGNCA